MENTARRKARFPYFSLALLLVGLVFFIGGLIFAKNIDMSKFVKLKDVSETITDNPEHLTIDVSYVDLVVTRSEDEEIHITGTNVDESLKIREANGVLSISDKSYSGMNGMSISIARSFKKIPQGKLTVELPDRLFGQLEIDAGVGDVTIENLYCESLDIDAGVGDLVIRGIRCEGRINADAGVGDARIEDIECDVLDLDAGVGDVNINGSIKASVDIDAGVGDITISLTEPEDSYSFTGEYKRYGGKGGYKITIDSGVGDVSIRFI
ncbi:MAG: DUF4097 family beta strand repeat protein [Ruminococcus sp.]|nr:DUF4097 family beta strand repeat protein [Ruminococcus sp.]